MVKSPSASASAAETGIELNPAPSNARPHVNVATFIFIIRASLTADDKLPLTFDATKNAPACNDSLARLKGAAEWANLPSVKTVKGIKSAIAMLSLKDQISIRNWLSKQITAEEKRHRAIDEILDEVLRERPSRISCSKILEQSRR